MMAATGAISLTGFGNVNGNQLHGSGAEIVTRLVLP
jgi:hypothetical protein